MKKEFLLTIYKENVLVSVTDYYWDKEEEISFKSLPEAYDYIVGGMAKAYLQGYEPSYHGRYAKNGSPITWDALMIMA